MNQFHKVGNRISWRYLLWWLGELKEDEWITAKNFASLFNVPVVKFYAHIRCLNLYGYIISRRKKLEEGVISVREDRIKEYQLTLKGKFKVEQWRERGSKFVRKDNKYGCPNCGFLINIKEFKFIDEVVSKKDRL